METVEVPLGPVSRVARTLMLLASTFVIAVALPVFAWQMTSLAEVRTTVEGTEYVLKVVKRHGQHSVRVAGPDGTNHVIPLHDGDGKRLDGGVAFDVLDDGQLVVVHVGDATRRLRFRDGRYDLESVEPPVE